MKGSTLTTLQQPRGQHTGQRNVMLPTGKELEKQISITHQWTELFTKLEAQKRLPDLLQALEKLPSSDVQAVRLALVLFRTGNRVEAVNILGRHKDSILARAWDFTFKVFQGQVSKLEDFQLWEEKFKEFGKPDGREVTLEGFLRMHMSFLTGYVTLGREGDVLRHAEVARWYLHVLQDQSTGLVIDYDLARLTLMQGDLQKSMVLQKQIHFASRDVRPMLHETTALNLVWGAYLTGLDAHLPAWGVELLEGLRSHRAVHVEVLHNGINMVTLAFSVLRQLTDHWMHYFPIYTVQEHKTKRDGLVDVILNLQSDTPEAITHFFLTACKALACSMQGSEAALKFLSNLKFEPLDQIAVFECLRWMVVVQVHANLPNSADVLDGVFSQLRERFVGMGLHEQELVLQWGKAFTPYALWLLNRGLKDVRLAAVVEDFLEIDESSSWVYFKGQHLKRYPKAFLQEHVLDLLHGKEINKYGVDQARRHLLALQGLKVKASQVIFWPVLRQIETKMKCNLFER